MCSSRKKKRPSEFVTSESHHAGFFLVSTGKRMAIHPFIHPYMDAVLAIWSLGSFAASLRPEAERARARARGWVTLNGHVVRR